MRLWRKQKYRVKDTSGTRDKRLVFLMSVICLAAVAIVIRLFYMQVIEHDFYAALASGQHEIYKELNPERGKIYMQDTRGGRDDLYPLATNQDLYLIYAQPKDISDPEDAAEKLIDYIYEYDPHLVFSDIDPEEEKEQYEATVEANNIIAKEETEEKLITTLSKEGDPYEPLKKRVTSAEMEEIESLDIEGIDFIKEQWRYYPEKNIGSHVAGFLGLSGDDKFGRYGVEGYFDEELTGAPGHLSTERDAAGRWIAISERDFKPAVNGSDIILTIDNAVEYFACSKLNEHALRHGADAGSVVIMEVETGAILAMCSYPDFDPNNYSEVDDIDYFNNQTIFSAYEPGSIFKPLTMAGAIDQGKLTPDTTYIDEGVVKISGYEIKNADHKVYGEQNMIQVLNESINTGAIFAARKLGPDLFRKYVEDFGFGMLSGIRLDKEMAGNISSLYGNGEIYMATASFGQGITATPLQMVAAYNAIANGGKLMAPYIIDKVIDSDGNVRETHPQALRRVISERAATLVSGMLVSVVREGHSTRAGVPGYYMGGKTGTAQVADEGTGRYGSRTIHSFVGFGPVDHPKFTMIVRLDDPKDVQYAASSAAPLFGEIAAFVLNYYQVPFDEEPEN